MRPLRTAAGPGGPTGGFQAEEKRGEPSLAGARRLSGMMRPNASVTVHRVPFRLGMGARSALLRGIGLIPPRRRTGHAPVPPPAFPIMGIETILVIIGVIAVVAVWSAFAKRRRAAPGPRAPDQRSRLEDRSRSG